MNNTINLNKNSKTPPISPRKLNPNSRDIQHSPDNNKLKRSREDENFEATSPKKRRLDINNEDTVAIEAMCMLDKYAVSSITTEDRKVITGNRKLFTDNEMDEVPEESLYDYLPIEMWFYILTFSNDRDYLAFALTTKLCNDHFIFCKNWSKRVSDKYNELILRLDFSKANKAYQIAKHNGINFPVMQENAVILLNEFISKYYNYANIFYILFEDLEKLKEIENDELKSNVVEKMQLIVTQDDSSHSDYLYQQIHARKVLAHYLFNEDNEAILYDVVTAIFEGFEKSYALKDSKQFNVWLSIMSCFDRFHIDGLRVDAVASMLYLDYSRKEGEWVPNRYGGRENIDAIEFLRYFNDIVHRYYPGVLTIAEESTAFAGLTKPTGEYGLGFDYKWNMGWMHDVLFYFSKDPIYRRYDHNKLTFGMLYQYSEHFMMVISHDEVVHGKGSLMMKMGAGSMSEKAQNLRALYVHMWMWPGKKCLFMGCEFGQSSEWQHDGSLDWHLLQYGDHSGVQEIVRDLNRLYCGNVSLALKEGLAEGFEWVNPDASDDNVISYLRFGESPGETFLVVGNFSPVYRDNYRVGVPYVGYWKEVINSDASKYGGTGAGNSQGLCTEAISWNGRDQSISLILPGLSVQVFKYFEVHN